MWLLASNTWLLASNMWLLASKMWLLAANMWLLSLNMWLLTHPGKVLNSSFLKGLTIVWFNSNIYSELSEMNKITQQ